MAMAHDAEATVTVEGQLLTAAEAMTLRVALTSWLTDLADDKERREALGPIADLYLKSGRCVLELLTKAGDKP